MKRLLIVLLLVGARSLQASDTLSLDLGAALDNYPQTEDGYWVDTYTENTSIEQGVFSLAHTGTSDGGGGMAYWSGYTLCTSGDTTNYGQEGSSDGWITRQWGCMAGGGRNKQGKTEKGYPYLVAYWGFFEEGLNPGYYSLRIDFTDQQAYRPLGAWICNHPWPYYGNINGDGFAGGFTKEGDYFALVAHGLNAQGEPTGATARLELASFHNGQLVQSADWQYMDLTSLGSSSGLYFTMETSDVDAIYGANTAVYFCLGGLEIVRATPAALPRPTGLAITAATEDSLTLAWNAVDGAGAYALFLNGAAAGITTDTTFAFAGLQAYTEYTLGVIAVAGNDSSETAYLTARTLDMTAPTMPANLTAEADVHSIALCWDASTDNVGIRRYTVYVDGVPYRRTTDTCYTITGLETDTEYTLEVEAADVSGNVSPRAQITVRTRMETALRHLYEDRTPMRVYAIDGRYMGETIPARAGLYIVQTQQQTFTIIIN